MTVEIGIRKRLSSRVEFEGKTQKHFADIGLEAASSLSPALFKLMFV
jgi:hypothetical protein